MSRTVGSLVVMLGIALLAAPLVAQQPLNWSNDDGHRVATLKKNGFRLEGEHVILWCPKSLVRSDAEALVRRLDPGVAGLWRNVGTHAWQAVPKGKITYYLSDDTFVAHASGRGAVFVPMARVRDGRAPFLHEATHELLASTRTDRSSGGPPSTRPLWLTEGLADYFARLVAGEIGIIETGPFDTPTIAGADAICAERARTEDGAAMIPYIGRDERPEVLFTTDRRRFAPTFYACSLSFVSYLGDHVGLNNLVDLFAVGPAEMNIRLDGLKGKRLAEWRAEWLKLLNPQSKIM
jgi:hypothetical protein